MTTRKTLRLPQQHQEPAGRNGVEFLVNGEVVTYHLKRGDEIPYQDLMELEQQLTTLSQLERESENTPIAVAGDVVERVIQIAFHDELAPEALAGLTPRRIEEIADFMVEQAQAG